MTFSDTKQMLTVACHLESRADDAYMEHDYVFMTPKEVHALAGDLKRWADLIDRPTCHMDLTETVETDKGKVRVWECSGCGREHEETNGAYGYCPHCGAEVVDD